ncbi:MAG: hypothetical protein LBG59_00340 [Candidatus Peribacteria bacterium]|jgi:hypothetical protein|nr:hypothetical protein [Candidatus Peribacteria bacterium]
MLYDEQKKLLYEGRNIYPTSGNNLFYGDLYLNGKFLTNNVPVAYLGAGGGNSTQFSYQPQQNVLDIIREDSDGCGQTFHMQSIALSTQETPVEAHLFKNWMNNQIESSNGAVLIYQNKKLEVFPIITTGTDVDTYALKYRYAVRE